MRPAHRALPLLLLALLPAPAAAEVRQSAHYAVTVRGDCPEVPELLRVADALHGKLAAHFGRRPGGGKLEIEYFASLTDYNDRLRAEGFPEDAYSPEGRFWNHTKKVYARRLDWEWDTRRALIVALTDQFQALSVQSKTKGAPTWYRAGLFAHFGVHRWDGKTLVVGADDEPSPWGREIGKFFEEAREKRLDATAAATSDARSLMEAWPLVHYCLASGDRTAYARFRGVEKRMWDGLEPREAAQALLGPDPKRMRDAIQEWYAGQRLTWTPVRDLWERTAEDGFAALPRPSNEALLAATGEAGEAPFVEAVVAPGKGATAGLVLHLDDSGAFVALTWRPGGALTLERRITMERADTLETGEGPAGEEARLRLEASADGVIRVSVAGKQVLAHAPADPALLGKGRAGLLSVGGPARFTSVKCSAVKPPKR